MGLPSRIADCRIQKAILNLRVVPNSWQPAELTGYLGRLCWLLL